MDIVKDATIAVGGTTLLIQPYLRSTQVLMDKGVRSADPDLTGGDRWEITGSTQRVEVILGDTGAKAQADIQAQYAKRRVEEFERGTDILKYAEDVTALAGLPGKAEELIHLSPHGWMLKAVQLGTRAEHIAINAVLLINNRKNLECVEYLSKAGGEAAFEVRALETCDQRKKSLNENEREERIVGGGAPFLAAPVHSPLHAMLQEDTNAYKEAVSDLLGLMEKEGADNEAIKKALDRVSAAEGEVAGALESMQAIVLEHETLSDADLELLQKNASFAGKNYTLYLSVADKLMAVKAGEKPETDLPKAGTEAIQEADNATSVASKVDIRVPEAQSILVIQNAKVERLGESQLRVSFGVRNVGSGTATDVKVQASEGNEQAIGAEGVGTILPNAEQQVTLTVPLPSGDAITLQAWVGDNLLDSRQEPVPSVTKATPESVVQNQGDGSTGMWISTGIIAGTLALGLVAFALMRKSKKRKSL